MEVLFYVLATRIAVHLHGISVLVYHKYIQKLPWTGGLVASR